jgi:hypothetical protein
LGQAIGRVIDSGNFLRESEVAAFEEEWAACCSQSYCVACNSGTDALTLAALATEIRRAVVQANRIPLTVLGLRPEFGASIGEIDASGRSLKISRRKTTVMKVCIRF